MGLRIMIAAGVICLIGVIQLLVGSSGSTVAILVAGAMLGVLPYGLWLLLESSPYHRLDLYLPGVVGVVGIFLGGLVRWWAYTSEFMVFDGLAVLLGGVSSGITVAWRWRQSAQRCQHCQRPLTPRFYQCPRCSYLVCAESTCWNAEACRCADCNWLRRPLLALEGEQWWTERLGSPLRSGNCYRCGESASDLDLRRCGRCPRAMCTQCWDLENGLCVKCGWLMPDLPESLQACHEDA